jgi:hypothetical protein
MRIDASGPGSLRAEGEIVDGGGVSVGHRELTGKAGDCGGLARAVGVWASLVLDAEMSRPHVARANDEQPLAILEQEGKASPPADPQLHATARSHVNAGDKEPDTGLTPPMLDEKPSRRDEARTQELGAGAFLMTGAGGGVLVGGTPYAVIEVAKGVFIRPALALGGSLPAARPEVTWVATRLDGCLQVAGLYSSRRGMQLDMCGGVDVGMLEVTAHTMPYVAVGPSLDLRGELDGDLAVILRGVVGINAIHQDSLDTPLLAGRVELALSWRLQ